MTNDENDDGWIMDETGDRRRIVRGRGMRAIKYPRGGYVSNAHQDDEVLLPSWSAGGVPFTTRTGTTSAGSWVPTATTMSPVSIPPTAAPARPKPTVPRQLPIPSKAPRRVVIAFVDDEGEVEWCGMVYPDTVDVNMDIAGPPEMQIAFKLIDANDEGAW